MKHSLKKFALLFALLLAGGILFPVVPAAAASVSLFTEYTGIAVTPGESINYYVDIMNNSGSIQRVSLEIIEQPEGWEANLTAGGWNVNQLSVKPNDEQRFTLQTEVPLQVEKGSYRFVIRATDNSGQPPHSPSRSPLRNRGFQDRTGNQPAQYAGQRRFNI